MPYHHLNTLTIFPERLRHNLNVLAKLQPDIQPVPVVKSNAYGHGIKIVAPMLNDFQIPFVCVDSLYEAFELEKNGYRGDILIMGYVDPRDIPRRRNFRYAVSSLEYALALVKRFSWIRLHLFLDTGMRREGMQLNKKAQSTKKKEGFASVISGMQVPSVAGNLHDPEPCLPAGRSRGGRVSKLTLSTQSEPIVQQGDVYDTYTVHHLTLLVPNIEGIMSHLASPDIIEISNKQQVEFDEIVEQLLSLGIQPKYIHLFASGGLIHSKKYSSQFTLHSSQFTHLARTGLAFYGYGHPDLLPALRCTTHIAQIKNIGTGESIGYDGTFTAEKSMKIAILPIGYHDGMDRRLSNTGFVTISGELCPIIGRVSMNITTVDISHLIEVSIGDEVIFLDENSDSPVSLERQAERAGMIPYDMLVHLSKEMFRTI